MMMKTISVIGLGNRGTEYMGFIKAFHSKKAKIVALCDIRQQALDDIAPVYSIPKDMQFISPDVATICTGMAASMGSVLLAAGTPGKRSALPHSRVMIHQPLGGARGQASDILIAAEEIRKTRDELCSIIAEHSGQPMEKILADADRDFWMTSQEALDYGMIDSILTGKKRA
jgi:ATP-dependent Clp protease protease subunit